MDIRELINAGLKKAGSSAELGKAVGVSRQSVEKWLTTETNMRTEIFLGLLKFVGGDIERALPTYDPKSEAVPEAQREIERLRGEVATLRSAMISAASYLTDQANGPRNVYMIAEGPPLDYTSAKILIGDGSDDPPPPPPKKPRTRKRKYPTAEE